MRRAANSQAMLVGVAIAFARVATGLMFVLFGEYKLVSGQFAYEGFPKYLAGYIQHDAVRWYAAVLQSVVAPHPVPFGYAVGVIELLIGLAMLLGWWVRPMSVVGALFMVNMVLCTWWAPGPSAPVWQYFGAELEHIPLLLLFLIFFASDAGTFWGVDGFGRRRM